MREIEIGITATDPERSYRTEHAVWHMLIREAVI